MIESLNHTRLTVEAWKGGVPSIQGPERGPPPHDPLPSTRQPVLIETEQPVITGTEDFSSQPWVTRSFLLAL